MILIPQLYYYYYYLQYLHTGHRIENITERIACAVVQEPGMQDTTS